MKRTVRWAALAAALLAAAPAAFAQAVPKPAAEVTRFQVEAITLRDVTFLFELTVSNPYPVALSFSGMSLDFAVEGSKVFSVANQGGFKVPAKGKKASTFTVTLPYDAIIKLVKDYASKDWLLTVVSGKLSIPLPKVPGLSLPADVSFSYRLEKKIPAIKPTVAITGFTVTPPTAAEVTAAIAKAGKAVDPAKARAVFGDILAGRKPAAPVIDPKDLDLPLKVSFTIEIRNEARGPLDFTELGYELFINGESLVVGDAGAIKRVGQSVFVTVTGTFSSKRLSEAVRRLFSERRGKFRVRGSTTVKLPDAIRKEPVKLGFDEKGSFALK